MDAMAKDLARCLINKLEEIESESGMERWASIADVELRNEALNIRETIRNIKGKLGQI